MILKNDTLVKISRDAMNNEDRKFSFHIEGPLAANHTAPAEVIVQILENAQRAFELIGMSLEGKIVKSRARRVRTISEKYQLVCQLPEHGCYAMPIVVGGESSDLLAPIEAAQATDAFKSLLKSLKHSDINDISKILPDSRLRNRILECIKGMMPSTGSAWRLDFYDGTDDLIAEFSDFDTSIIDGIIEDSTPREANEVVTGTLASVDFKARKLTIIYPVTKREMDCYYPEELEDLLFKNRRGPLQVTGRMILDDNNVPKSIVDVSDIRAIDLAPFQISTVFGSDYDLIAIEPLKLTPTLDDSMQFMCLQDEHLHIDVFASTRPGLLPELNEQITMLWEEFALADPAELDEVALKLRGALKNKFKESKHAS
jgi:hypothetical protein